MIFTAAKGKLISVIKNTFKKKINSIEFGSISYRYSNTSVRARNMSESDRESMIFHYSKTLKGFVGQENITYHYDSIGKKFDWNRDSNLDEPEEDMELNNKNRPRAQTHDQFDLANRLAEHNRHDKDVETFGNYTSEKGNLMEKREGLIAEKKMGKNQEADVKSFVVVAVSEDNSMKIFEFRKFGLEKFPKSAPVTTNIEQFDFIPRILNCHPNIMGEPLKIVCVSMCHGFFALASKTNIKIHYFHHPTYSFVSIFQNVHSKPINKLIFTPDSNRLLSCSEDGRIRISNIKTNKIEDHEFFLSRTGSPIQAMELTHDGLNLAFGDNEGDLRIINLEQKKVVLQINQFFNFPLIHLKFDLIGSLLMVISKSGEIHK